ncbi:protein TRC8 homolog isoform X2 [Episyrphus balteatus]|uniref:protein TRC8 homolog isoform X2 n=1 Tax=Episyrphus balteatus TaxID=286459 RepID=UPI002486A270|nr:protein TRC8 homolog isoform X2 [Episyrphus balteatus]
MSFRAKVLGLVDVMMRVPPILVIDEILKIGMGLPTRLYPPLEKTGALTDDVVIEGVPVDGNISSSTTASNLSTSTSNLTNNNNNVPGLATTASAAIGLLIKNATETVGGVVDGGGGNAGGGFVVEEGFEAAIESNLNDILSITAVKFVICLVGFLCAACIFMLWTRHLVMVYLFVISVGLTFLSYWSNVSALALMESGPCLLVDILSFNTSRLLDPGGVVLSLMPHLVAQWFMGMLFAYIHLGPRYEFLQKKMPFIFVSPILLAMLPLPPSFLKLTPAFAGIIPFILTKITLYTSAMEAGKTILNGYEYAMNFVSNFGLSALIENEWQRLNVPCVLRVFWSIRIGQELISLIFAKDVSLNVIGTVHKLLSDGCETLTAVLGMTSVISIVCHYIGKMFQWFLMSGDTDEEKSLGTVSAVLFYILALQTGLTSLSPDKRFIRLCRNLCLLVTALLHFLHNIVSPILMSLSAARSPSRKRHTRALVVCVFLLVAPISLLLVLWSRHSPSTWMLAVTAFSVEVIVKVLVSLATYALFLYDARRDSFWEKLDDYVYYVRAFGNSVEFCFGILLFFNGAWILFFESGGAIRAIMMCIHAYFNIWCEARAGWSIFMKRRSAVDKISALPEATEAQLNNLNDVCAICHQQMESAKITRCRHFFHGVCLRKWLYVQDRCPLCHEIMMYIDRPGENNQIPANNQQEERPNNNNAQELLRRATGQHETREAVPNRMAAVASIGTSLPTAAAASSVAGTASSSNSTGDDSSSSIVHNFRLSPPPVELQE